MADDFTVADRRAGRISEKEDIDALLEAIQDITIDGCSFLVRSLTEHRLALVMRGAGLSGKVANTDPGTACEGQPVNDPGRPALRVRSAPPAFCGSSCRRCTPAGRTIR